MFSALGAFINTGGRLLVFVKDWVLDIDVFLSLCAFINTSEGLLLSVHEGLW